MAAKKGPEMVQTTRNGDATSLWRTISAPQSSRQAGDGSKIIGASYSHADMLKFDTLNIAGPLRSRLSPLEPKRSSSRGSSPSSATTSPQKPDRYTRFVPGSGSEFLVDDDHDDDDHEDISAYDDDEDEFGLPSMRRAGKRRTGKKVIDPGGHGLGRPLPLSFTTRTHSSPVILTAENGDIAEERGLPTYPTASRGEGKILRPQYQEILRDPANSLHLISHPPLHPNATAKEKEAHGARIGRINKFKRILQTSSVSLSELRDLAWSGIPTELRAISWQILLSYLPTNGERRVSTLARKRKEYQDGVLQAFGTEISGQQNAAGIMSPIMGSRPSSARAPGTTRGIDEAVWHQISIDVPRTNPHLELYSYEATQRSLERILYVWAIRHPASGYVQGINDLVTPFWQVFLGSYITDADIESGLDPGGLPKAVLDAVEADTFWCLTKLLDGIQDNYIFAQPGIQRQVGALRDLTTRIDEKLAKHLDAEGVEFIQFSFRWMNCLLMREISVKSTIRMWDTYLAEDQGFSHFHLYVCAAFLVKWSDKLMTMDFQEIMMFLQSLPTKAWDEKDIELLLSEAFIWQSLFRGSKAHIQQTNSEIAPLNL